MKKYAITLSALMAVITMSTQAELMVGDWINIDYGTGNDVNATARLGAAGDQGAWGTYGAGYQPNTLVDASGASIALGAWSDNGFGASGSQYQWGGATGNSLSQDYTYLSSDGTIDTDLHGTLVDSYRRMTVFGNDLSAGMVWNVTFMGNGNVNGQGLNIKVTDGAGFQFGSTTGANVADLTWESGRNFVTLNNVTLTGNELQFWQFTDAATTTSAISGIQMELVAIPEPATLGLIGAFGGAILFIRRRFMI